MAAAAAAATLMLGLAYLGLADADAPIAGGNELRAQIDRRGWSLFRPVASRGEIVKHAAQTRAQQTSWTNGTCAGSSKHR